jgi:hypothetical protein
MAGYAGCSFTERSMILPLRLWLSRLPWLRLKLPVLVVTSLTACSSIAETSLEKEGPADDARRTPTLSASASGCTPSVDGLLASGIEPVEIDCPRGYAQRASFDALPTAGRFSTAVELLDAFCIEKRTTRPPRTDLRAPRAQNEPSIDFAKNDVVVYAFDARNSEPPALLERGNELWLRTTRTCASEPSELRSVAFVVAKARTINEQKCSPICQ